MRLRRSLLMTLAALPLLLIAGLNAPASAENAPNAGLIPGLDIRDMHGRSLLAREIPIVDWEGQVANPVIELHLIADDTFSGPFTLLVSADGGRLQFNKPSTVSATGPSKEVDFAGAGSKVIYLSVFPDRDGDDETYTLTLQVEGEVEQVTIPILVRDDDLPGDTPPFEVHTNFVEDTTGFFDDALTREVATLAASDWAYFIDNPPFDQVAAGDEPSFIYDANATTGDYVDNIAAYSGYLLYFFGWNHPSLISGGHANYTFDTKRQKVGGTTWTPELGRSGGVGAETRGNYNELGWYISAGEDDWWTHTNANDQITDFYSIMSHEIGHALAFHTSFEKVEDWEQAGFATSPAITDYYGGNVPIVAAFDHFQNVVDPASLKGAFGWEYGGEMPNFRWQITKLDLLLMEALGYPLRDTSALREVTLDLDLVFQGAGNSPAAEGIPFDIPLLAEWGVPPYRFEITAGVLPDGLTLDGFTGEISGVLAEDGSFDFTVTVTDSALGGQSSDSLSLSLVQQDSEFDANCDGEVTVADALAVMRGLAGFTTGLLPVEPCTGDNDGEPGISIADVRGIRAHVAALESPNLSGWYLRAGP